MGEPKQPEYQEASFEQLQSSPEQTTKQLDPARGKTRRAIRYTLEEGKVKEKDLLDPFTQELVDLESKIGFVAAVKKLQHKMPRFTGFSIQEWYAIYMNTRPNSKLRQKALGMMERLEFDARNLEEMQILYTIAQPDSPLKQMMQERMSRIK